MLYQKVKSDICFDMMTSMQQGHRKWVLRYAVEQSCSSTYGAYLCNVLREVNTDITVSTQHSWKIMSKMHSMAVQVHSIIGEDLHIIYIYLSYTLNPF